jgi:mRNA interferase MazF
MVMKKAGQIVLFKFLQSNYKTGKLRPALLIAQLPGKHDEWLICMISSQKHQYIDGYDEIISIDSSDFIQSGLKVESIIRTTRLAVCSRSILLGNIGEISDQRFIRIINKISDWIRGQ